MTTMIVLLVFTKTTVLYSDIFDACIFWRAFFMSAKKKQKLAPGQQILSFFKPKRQDNIADKNVFVF
jgi:hypothetical protein